MSKLGIWLTKVFIHDIRIHTHTLLTITKTLTLCTFTYKHTFLVLRIFWTNGELKSILNKTQAVFFFKKIFISPSLDLNDSPIYLVWKGKYMGIILDSKLTWCKQIKCSVHKFYFTKNNVPQLLCSNKNSLSKKGTVI